MTDPLKAAEEAAPEVDAVSLLDLIELSNNERLGRIADSLEKATAALGRLASSSETLVALLASVIGVGYSTCYSASDSRITTTPAVNYVRAGTGAKAFGCDAANLDSDDD